MKLNPRDVMSSNLATKGRGGGHPYYHYCPRDSEKLFGIQGLFDFSYICYLFVDRDAKIKLFFNLNLFFIGRDSTP